MASTATPILAVSAIVRRGTRFLLVQRGRPPIKGMYAFPGGRVDAGETLEAAALRELREETDLIGKNPQLYRVYDLPSAVTGETEHESFRLSAFIVEVDGNQAPAAGDDAANVGWYTADEARALPIPESVRECIEDLASA